MHLGVHVIIDCLDRIMILSWTLLIEGKTKSIRIIEQNGSIIIIILST